MRDLTGGEWEGYHPMTNVMVRNSFHLLNLRTHCRIQWLHYLASKLLHSKALKAPGVVRKGKNAAEAPLRLAEGPDFSEKACYEALVDMEQWLGQTLVHVCPTKGAKASLISTKGRSRRTTVAPVAPVRRDGPSCAGEIVEYGVKKGWIRRSALF